MQFYTKNHPYYCGIDLHARSLYVCIINHDGEICIHQEIKASPEHLMRILEPYIGNIIVGVECMHCWYWVADWCEDNAVDFILGHALYMKAIHGGKAKTDKIDSFKIAKLLRGGTFPVAYHYPKSMRATRDLLRRRMKIIRHGAMLKAHVSNTLSQYNLPVHGTNLRYSQARDALRETFNDKYVQANINLDLNLVEHYDKELRQIEKQVENHAIKHFYREYHLLKSIKGVGKILALTILYEIGDIQRFDSVQKFASYSRLVKCKAESAGKIYGTSGAKIGNAHLKWAFSEACVLYLRGNDDAQRYLAKLQRRMPKSKALSVLAHKLGRCVYFMLRNKTLFNEDQFMKR